MSLDYFRVEVQGFINKIKHNIDISKMESEKINSQIQSLLKDSKYSKEYKDEQVATKKRELAEKKEKLQNEIISTFQEAHELGKHRYKKAGEHSQEDEIRLLRKQLSQRDLVDDLISYYQNRPASLNILADKLAQSVNKGSEEASAYLRAYKRLKADSTDIETSTLINWAEKEIKKSEITDQQKEVTEIMDSLYRLKVEHEKSVIEEQITEGKASTIDRIALKNRLHELTNDINLNGLAQDVYTEEEEEVS